MRIGIVGSRRRNSGEDMKALLTEFFKHYKPGDIIVSGGCPVGADAFAEMIAKTKGISILIHYPDKKLYGIPACYFVRNSCIAEDSDLLLALRAEDHLGGTEDTANKTLALGKKVIYVGV